MWAVVIAASLMMWIWSAASLHCLGLLARNADYPVRMAYLAVIVILGVTVILLSLWWVLPGSKLSLGWSLKQLQGTQQISALLVLLTAAAGIWRSHFLLRPTVTPKVLTVTTKTVQKKRRP